MSHLLALTAAQQVALLGLGSRHRLQLKQFVSTGSFLRFSMPSGHRALSCFYSMMVFNKAL